MRWKSILAMLLALGLLCLTAGCKQTEQQQGQTQATPDASAQTVLQQNPLLAELVAFSAVSYTHLAWIAGGCAGIDSSGNSIRLGLAIGKSLWYNTLQEKRE